MRDVYLGADLGTSGLKLLALDAGGDALAEAEASYPVVTPRPGWAETDPQAWLDALRSALASLAPALAGTRVRALGIDGQMHGLVLADAGHRPCRPAVLWPDRRAEPVLAGWRALPEAVRGRLANPLVAGMTGPVLDWLVREEPGALDGAAAVLLPKDWVRAQLAGGAVTERSDASATLLWDVVADDWARDVVAARQLPGRLLPPVVPSDEVVGTADLTAMLGNGASSGDGRSGVVASEVAVVAGAADTPAALLGLGGLPPGVVQVNLGTGAQVLESVAEPAPAADAATHLYADADGGWYAMVAVQNAGLALGRVRELLGLGWPELFGLASGAPAGAGGVSFLPFLTGERGGLARPSSRGAWLGIDDRTTRADLARAAVEATVFAVRRSVELRGSSPVQVRLSGGGSRSPLVPRTLADLLGVEVTVVRARSASAAGAAVLAARGVDVDLRPPVDEAPPLAPEPAPAVEDAYRRWRNRLGAADL